MNPPVALIPLSTIYGAVIQTRLAAYRRGWLSTAKLPVPVFSVGNLTTGGTGKTPLVELVCKTLASVDRAAAERKRVCVLTRGYGRDNQRTQVVVSNGTELLATAREAGDEPFLLATNLLGSAAVIANANRVAAARWALEQLKTDVFVLDDGFQHLALARDFDIVTIDATNPWGGGSLLPYGHLREPLSGLTRADCVIVTRTDEVADVAPLKTEIAGFVKSIPIFSSRMVTRGVHDLSGAALSSKEVFTKDLGAFCGVGNPASFFTQVRRAGGRLLLTRSFADHHQYTQAELDSLIEEAKASGAKVLITTAKDAVRLADLSLTIPCYVIDIEISIDDATAFDSLLLQTVTKNMA